MTSERQLWASAGVYSLLVVQDGAAVAGPVMVIETDASLSTPLGEPGLIGALEADDTTADKWLQSAERHLDADLRIRLTVRCPPNHRHHIRPPPSMIICTCGSAPVLRWSGNGG